MGDETIRRNSHEKNTGNNRNPYGLFIPHDGNLLYNNHISVMVEMGHIRYMCDLRRIFYL